MSSYDMDRGPGGIIADLSAQRIKGQLYEGNKVRFRHHNTPEYIVAEVIEVSEFDFKIKSSQRLIQSTVLPGDHVAVNFISKSGEELQINGVIEEARAAFPQYYKIKVMRMENFRDARKNRRYAVNICCDITDENREFFGIIKNISMSGFRMFTKDMIEDRKNINVKMYFNEDTNIDIYAGLVRSKQLMNSFEYGLVILGTSDQGRGELREIISRLKNIEENL